MRPGPISSSRLLFEPTQTGSSVPADYSSLLSTLLLGLILAAGVAVLGAVRLWMELPLLVAVTVLLLIQALRLMAPAHPTQLRRIDAIDGSVLLFLLYAIARWLTSPTEYFSRIEILSLIGYAAIFFFCRYGVARRSYGIALLIGLVGLGLGETCFGYLFSHHSDLNDPASLWFPFGETERLQLHYAPRWIGTYGNPNHYASLLVMATAATLALGAFSKFDWPLRIVFFYFAGLLAVGILYSQSRGSWLSLVGALIALMIFALRYSTLRWWMPTAGIVLILALLTGIFATSSLVQGRMTEVYQTVGSGDVTTYVRIQLARDALRISHDYLFFGTGPATFTFIHPRYQSSTFGEKAVMAHDDYLNCLTDYGLVGFALAMIFVCNVTLALLNRLRADARWMDRVQVAAGFMIWSALLVHSFLDFNLHVPANAMIFFAMTGLSLQYRRGEIIPRHWSTLSLQPLGRWLGVGLFIFGLLYGAEIVRTGLAEIPFEMTAARAEASPGKEGEWIAPLRQALAFDPDNVPALTLLGDLYRVSAEHEPTIEEQIAQGQLAQAAYQKALKGNPLDDSLWARLGLTFDVMHRYAEAYFCYQKAVTAQPYDGQFWSALGNHFIQCGLFTEAKQAFLQAASCPHGNEGAEASAQQVQKILDRESAVTAAPAAPPAEEPPTAP